MDGQTLVDLLRRAGEDPRGYSGRAMYGRRCVAIEIDGAGDLLGIGIRLAGAAGPSAPDAGGLHRIAAPNVDTLGLRQIAFWRDVDWPGEQTGRQG